MEEFSHLADRFKTKFKLGGPGSGQRYGQSSGPPQQMQTPYQQAPPYPQSPSYAQAHMSYDGGGYSQPSVSPTGPNAGSAPLIPPRPQKAPIIPPRPAPRTQEPLASSNEASFIPKAGAIYAPGAYPVPELPLYPLQKHVLLQPSSAQEYTSATIQNALKSMGPSSTVYLLPGSIWKVESTIFFQELATHGYPTGETMAVLDAQKGCDGSIIHAFDRSGVRVRNLVVEGNKEKYGWNENGGVMVQLGGGKAHNQVLDHCVLRNTRHWSCVQAFEGSHNVRITNNAIGPAGVGCDVESGRWADGISYAAADGLVAGNLVIDTTDGGIVLFNAPGTLVTSNTIVAKTRLGLGAINMVDPGVYDGNYTFTRVTHNTIVTAGSMLKIGIGQGPSVWWQQDKKQICRGGIVSHNLITRITAKIAHSSSSSYNAGLGPLGTGTIGYGFPVGSDITDWTCIENVSEDNVRYEGDISGTLPAFLNAAPGPFVHDRFGHSEGDEVDMSRVTLQPEFVQGKVWGLIGIDEGPSKVLAYYGDDLRMKRGEKLHLHGIEIAFREDAELCVYQKQDNGETYSVWEAGIRSMIDSRHPGFEHATLIFTHSGKFGVVNGHQPGDVLLDLTPHVPLHLPPPSSGRPNFSRLTFSTKAPHILITSADGNMLYASSYSSGRFSDFPVGKYIARPTPHMPGGGVLVYSFSPQRQFVVAHTRAELPTKMEWPQDPNIYEVVCSIGDGNMNANDPKAKMGLQGDGHLVIYDGEGGAIWGSGTHGDRGADKLLFGIGTSAEPYLELVRENGERLWSA